MGRKGKEIRTEAPGNRKGATMFEEDYEVLKSFFLEKLQENQLTIEELEQTTVALFEYAFEDDILWLIETVLNDLIARKMVEERAGKLVVN